MRCKLAISLSVLAFNCLAVGNIGKAAVVAESLMNRELLQDINFQQGESFAFSSGKIAHKLYFDAKYEGLLHVVQIDCEEVINTGAIEECKTVKISRK
jgi:hypothetical protein